MLETWAKAQSILRDGERLRFEIRIEFQPPAILGAVSISGRRSVHGLPMLRVTAKASAKFLYIKPAEFSKKELSFLLGIFSGSDRRLLEFILIQGRNLPVSSDEIKETLGLEHIYDQDLLRINKRLKLANLQFRLAEARDHFGTTRRYLYQLCEICPKKEEGSS